MSNKHITINQLTNLEANYYLGIKARECAKRMQIGKDKVYYYSLFKEGKNVETIYNSYLMNKAKCGRKRLILTSDKIEYINELLNIDWSLDAIAGRDKIDNAKQRCSTKTLYRMAHEGIIDKTKLRRKGKRKGNNEIETRGKINICNTIHQRDEKYPNAKNSLEFGHFEGDTIVGEHRKSAIVTLVEKTTKYIVL